MLKVPKTPTGKTPITMRKCGRMNIIQWLSEFWALNRVNGLKTACRSKI